jgi:ubiquinone/menaquinone biosynthesis C-methylase UbiE
MQKKHTNIDTNRKQIIKNAYDIAAKEYADKCFFELSDKPLDKKLYDLFFERVVNKGSVIEIGCGPGEISNYLKMKGLDIIGLDLSDKMIEIAIQLNPFIDFRIGDVFDLKFQDNSVAGIVAPYLIVNFKLDDILKAFSEIHRVLVNNGQLLISFYSGKGDLEINDFFFVKGNTIPYTYFDSDTIKDKLIETGFRIIEYINRMPYEGEITTSTYIFAEKK